MCSDEIVTLKKKKIRKNHYDQVEAEKKYLQHIMSPPC